MKPYTAVNERTQNKMQKQTVCFYAFFCCTHINYWLQNDES